MAIEVTAGQVWECVQAMQGQMGLLTKPICPRHFFRLKKLYKELAPVHDAAEEARSRAATECGSPPGGRVPVERMSEFVPKFDEIMRQQIVVQAERVDLSDLKDLQLSFAQLEALSPFIIFAEA